MLRKKVGLSQRALAEGLVTKSMISQIETNKIQPSADLLTRIAQRLSVRPEQLLPTKHEDHERLVCYKQAQAFLTLRHFAEALPLLQTCLEDPHPSWSLLRLTYRTACCQQQLGAYQEARRLYEKALHHAICEEQTGEMIRLHVRLGEVAQSLGQLELALVEWRRAERELERHPAPPEEPLLALDVCLYLANGLRKLGGSREALHHYRLAEQFLQRLPEQTRRRAEVQFGIGLVLEKLEQFETAESCFEHAASLYLRAIDKRMATLARISRGRLLGKTGRHEEALTELRASLQEAKSLSCPEVEVRAYCELSQACEAMGKRMLAESLLQKGLAVKCECPVERGLTFLALAELHRDAQRYEEALEAVRQALYLLHENMEELLVVYQLLTDLYKRQEDYEQASFWAERADRLVGKQMQQRGWKA